MIKIEKDISQVPDSLQIPFIEFFSDGIPSPPSTTHQRRLELIKNEGYIDEQVYNSRYKQSDTKKALENIYKNLCFRRYAISNWLSNLIKEIAS